MLGTASADVLYMRRGRSANLLGERGTNVYKVPKKSDLPALFKHYHDDRNHSGINTTLPAIQELYSWKHIKEDIIDYIAICSVCLESKPTKAKLPMKAIVPKTRDERLEFDHFYLPFKDADGYKYVLSRT